MKKMKLAAIFAGLVSVFTFSSCLNDGDSGPNYDLYEIVTVEDGSIFGGPLRISSQAAFHNNTSA